MLPGHRPAAKEHRGRLLPEHSDAVGGRGPGWFQDGVQDHVRPLEIVKVHPSSSLFMRNPPPKWVVYNELVFTSKHYIRSVVVIEKEWLVELAPTFFAKKNGVEK